MAHFVEGERLYLREARITDAAIIARWKNDSLIREMSIGWETEITTENQEQDIRGSIDNPLDLYLLIILKESKRRIGYIRVNWLDKSGRFAWLRFGLGEMRGKGYAKEALQAVIGQLFARGVHRVDAEVYEFNHASLNLLQALGFKREGIRRQAHWQKGQYYDVHVLGILKDEKSC